MLAQRHGLAVPQYEEVPDLYDMQQSYASAPQEVMVAPETPEITVSTQSKQFGPVDLEALYNSYEGQPTVYSKQIEDARAASAAQQKQLEDAIRAAASKNGNAGPSKSELYFRLAQAFLTPGKTGNFTEGLAGAAGVGADYRGQQRAARKEQEDRQLSTSIELAKLKSGQSKEDLATLRALDMGERQDRRAVQSKLLDQYIQSGKPQSDVGKEAQDAGLTPGTPEFSAFVKNRIQQKMESGELYKLAMLQVAKGGLDLRRDAEDRAQRQFEVLSPKEMDLLDTAEEAASSGESAVKALEDAQALLKKGTVVESNLSGKALLARLEQFNTKDPRYVDTGTFKNKIVLEGMPAIKSLFGPQISNTDVEAMNKLVGSEEVSNKVREQILNELLRKAKSRSERMKKRAQEIRSGKFRLHAVEEQGDE